MDTLDALERQVHRIRELLVRSQEDVTWNDHISDPDNPEQLRQMTSRFAATENSPWSSAVCCCAGDPHLLERVLGASSQFHGLRVIRHLDLIPAVTY